MPCQSLLFTLNQALNNFACLTFSSPSRCNVDRGQTLCPRGSDHGDGGDHGDGDHGDGGGHGDGRGALPCECDDQFHCNYHRSPRNMETYYDITFLTTPYHTTALQHCITAIQLTTPYHITFPL